MIPLEDPTSLSLLFHLNSEPWLNDDAYKRGGQDIEVDYLGAPPEAVIALPVGTPTALDEAVARRKSSRAYGHGPISLADLASILRAAYGAVPDPERLRRAVPSAGALFPLDVYAVIRRVDGLDDGLYRYDGVAHTLDLLRRGELYTPLQPMFYAYPFVADANVVIALAAVFARTQSKYGPRGYRYILIEAGHVGQNVCLQATQLGLGSLCMGGFIDSLLNEFLGLDPSRAGVVYALGIGTAAADDPPPNHQPTRGSG